MGMGKASHEKINVKSIEKQVAKKESEDNQELWRRYEA